MKATRFGKTSTIGLALVMSVLSGCGGSGEASSRQPLSASEVETLGSEFETLAAAHVEAWNSHDVVAIIQLYADDIVVHDGDAQWTGPVVMQMNTTQMLALTPDFEGRLADTFINHESGLDEWEIWQWPSPSFTEENPMVEFDVLQARDGQIAYWDTFYDTRGLDFWGRSDEQLDAAAALRADYRSAWSSGDPGAVAALYAQDAVREDSLFGDRSEGRAAIRTFASHFFGWYPGASWQMLRVFGENSREPDAVVGGVYAIRVSDSQGEPCDVRMAVMLEPGEEGIASERIFYNAESLIACGWAR